MDYLPPSDDIIDDNSVELEEIVSHRDLWLFLSFIVLPIVLVIGGVFAFKQLQAAINSHIQVVITPLQGISKVSSSPAVPALEVVSTAISKVEDNKIISVSNANVADKLQESVANPATASNIAKPLIFTIKHKDSLKKVFKRAGLDEKGAVAILAIKKAQALTNLHAGKKISFILDPTKTKLQKLEYAIDDLNTLIVSAVSSGWSVEKKHIEPTVNAKYVAATINGSIYSAGKKAGIPGKLMAQLVSVFNNKISVNKLRNGDKIALFYKEHTIGGKKVLDSEIAAAEIVHKGEVHRIVSFTDPYGHTDFYTPDGRSIQPIFNRYPVPFKRIGSHFSHARYHPILGIVRPHLGVDFKASAGEPIRATSSGKIVFAGRRNGHGRVVVIKHGIYETLYAHLSSFANNIYAGGYVKKGQVIGRVGSSGLETAPHLHYEFHVNGVPTDPLKVKLPAGEMISSEHRGRFLKHSKQILAQLDVHRKGLRDLTTSAGSQFK